MKGERFLCASLVRSKILSFDDTEDDEELKCRHLFKSRLRLGLDVAKTGTTRNIFKTMVKDELEKILAGFV